MDFLIGGLAGVGAGFFSNPFDVIKTRMQLQGELKAKGKHAVHYKNVPHAIYNIAKHDGIKSLQSGLAPALIFQLVVNGTRLGIYQTFDNFGYIRDSNNDTKFMPSLIVGVIAGGVGGIFGSPLQMVKTQLMSSSSQKIAVGTQHKHIGWVMAFKNIYKEYGIAGLWRDFRGMMIRNSIGSAAQIVSFSLSKEWMNKSEMFNKSRYLSSFLASNIGAVTKTLFLTPPDVIMTRLFNQSVDAEGKGLLYNGFIDCARKIIKAEGFSAFYKGMGPMYLRQAPHTVLLLVFWDMLKDIQEKITGKLDK